MRIVRLISICLLLASLLPAQQSKPSNPAGLALPADLPNIPLFDVNALDKTAEPCVDFYKYACGGWMAKNPIPPDQSLWGRFSQLQERNRDVLHAILEFAAKPDPKRSPVMQKIGDFYEEEVDAATKDLLAMLEPIIIGILGLCVGGIVISLYMPLFSMISKLAG